MVKRIEYRYSTSINDTHADSSDCRRAFEYWILKNFGGLNGIPGDLYKWAGIDVETKTIINKTKNKIEPQRKKLNIDKEFVVELGGPFEMIGDKDEALGGGNQKMG